jgi:Mor family transcriptional regulator
MKEKAERNKQIYEAWIGGKTQFKLAIEYSMHPANVSRIISSAKKKYGNSK